MVVCCKGQHSSDQSSQIKIKGLQQTKFLWKGILEKMNSDTNKYYVTRIQLLRLNEIRGTTIQPWSENVAVKRGSDRKKNYIGWIITWISKEKTGIIQSGSKPEAEYKAVLLSCYLMLQQYHGQYLTRIELSGNQVKASIDG